VGVRVSFIYEGHRVKVKVTGAIKYENPYSRNVIKLGSAIPVLQNIGLQP